MVCRYVTGVLHKAALLPLSLVGCYTPQEPSSPTPSTAATGIGNPSQVPMANGSTSAFSAAPRNVSSASAAAPSASAAPPASEPWCDRRVTTFDRLTTSPTLRDALRTTSWTDLAELSLDEADCSGVGHYHLVFTSLSGKVTAYVSQELPTLLRSSAQTYLVGGERHPPRRIDLQRVCVPYASDVNAQVAWVLPLEADDVAHWRQRLDTSTCGRDVARCHGCSSSCSDGLECCQWVENSCPGPTSTHSSCAWQLPCDENCCR